MKSTDEIIRLGREALALPDSTSLTLSPMAGRGSDRTFSRLAWNNKDSAIVIEYDPKRVENLYYADIALFLRSIDVPVPRIIRHDPAACLILMEDLGDIDLWSLRESNWKTRQTLYRKTLVIVRNLHSFPEREFPSDRVMLMEAFGSDLYRWERNYFLEHFVRGACRIELEPTFERELERELSALAERLSGTVRNLVHRDLQSQNIMIHDGEPFLIDFQGMRFGTPFYDLGSLLCDPYVTFSDSERQELLSFYHGLSKWNLDWVPFQNYFWEASAQRLMQALGAYGFLGLQKGLTSFLDHIPAGLRNLRLAVEKAGTLPRLRELSTECRNRIER